MCLTSCNLEMANLGLKHRSNTLFVAIYQSAHTSYYVITSTDMQYILQYEFFSSQPF